MNLLIATPIRAAEYGVADVKAGYHDAVRELCRRMPVECLSPSIFFGADVVRARNRAVAHVLRDWPQITHLLWWDDDLWPDDIGIVQKMIDSDYDVVAGAYTNKQKPLRWIHEPIPGAALDDRGFCEVHSVGMGFTMMKRGVLQRVTEESYKHHEWRPYWDEWSGGHMVANGFGLLYERMFHGREGLRSEDYSFCKKWREIGGKIHIFGGPGNVLHHAGGHAWGPEDMPGGMMQPNEPRNPQAP
jgi:hypothetical protein